MQRVVKMLQLSMEFFHTNFERESLLFCLSLLLHISGVPGGKKILVAIRKPYRDREEPFGEDAFAHGHPSLSFKKSQKKKPSPIFSLPRFLLKKTARRMSASSATSCDKVHFAIDRGGTFTDVFARCGSKTFTLKLLSVDHAYPDAPREGIRRILEMVSIRGDKGKGFFFSERGIFFKKKKINSCIQSFLRSLSRPPLLISSLFPSLAMIFLLLLLPSPPLSSTTPNGNQVESFSFSQ